MANKMTQVQALSLAIDFINGVDMAEGTDFDAVLEKLSDMKIALEKKRATPSKADTAKAEEQGAIMTEIISALTALAKPSTIAEIQASSAALAPLTNQKMSAMLKKLVDNGKVVKTIEKKKTYFSIAE